MLSTKRNIAPEGWHVSSRAVWDTLVKYIGNYNTGGKLKEKGMVHWKSPNTGANNSSGFTSLPGGERDSNGVFNNRGYWVSYWTSSQLNENYSWRRILGFNWDGLGDAADFPNSHGNVI